MRHIISKGERSHRVASPCAVVRFMRVVLCVLCYLTSFSSVFPSRLLVLPCLCRPHCFDWPCARCQVHRPLLLRTYKRITMRSAAICGAVVVATSWSRCRTQQASQLYRSTTSGTAARAQRAPELTSSSKYVRTIKLTSLWFGVWTLRLRINSPFSPRSAF